ncbi:LCP family protein [Streptomyces sp. NPDC006739]|uniref:LCP family glycopolymer transferase n=1 Tax=Streptomyces sp. NPDC006739 TaxID=3364763 RepID=UPI00369D3D41
MSERWEGRGGQATRGGGARVPGQRAAEAEGVRPPGGRAAARATSRSRGSTRSRRRAQQTGRGRRALKMVAITLSGLVLVTAGAGWWFYEHLNGNIHSVSLDGKGGTEKADAFGRTPINVLLMGSDSRNSAADCKLGGACQSGGGERADVEMVVHISADRSNATVMSVPRDLVTSLPPCTDKETGQSVGARTDMINSALSYGPACQVAAVHHLTNIPIDHFMKVDFAGVVSISDAVGGVGICVDKNVYDPSSHLKLSAGQHTLKGVAALEFLRTRHGFTGGSDNVGRTSGQHAFLGAAIAKLKSAGTLTDPAAVYGLADAATKALTVDDGLGSVKKLISLASDLNKVPSKQITFVTMQNVPDPTNRGRVVQGPGAAALFQTIANDQSLTTATGKKSAGSSATSTTQPVDKSSVTVHVENGTSTASRASAILQELTGAGFSSASTAGNASAQATTTTLTYPQGASAQAKAVASALGLPASHVKQGSGTQIVLLIGSDWTTGTTYPGSHPSAAPADTHKALSGALARNGGDSACVHVSTDRTISVTADGTPTTAVTRWGVTPTTAYTRSPNVKDSAP